MEKNTENRGCKAEQKDSKETVEVHSLRLSDETMEGINDVKHAMGVSSTDHALKAMLNSFSMAAAKETLPERATEISEFEVMCRRMVDAYTHSLILCNDAEVRAQENVKQLLASKDNTIMDLQKTVAAQEGHLAIMQAELEKAKSIHNKMKENLDAALAELEALKQADRTQADLTSLLGTIQSQLGDINLKVSEKK